MQFADGSPVPRGMVETEPTGKLAGARGFIQPDGTFVMGTHSPDDGVPAGSWRVCVTGMDPPVPMLPTDATPVPPSVIKSPPLPVRYAQAETSGISFNVPEQTFWKIVIEK